MRRAVYPMLNVSVVLRMYPYLHVLASTCASWRISCFVDVLLYRRMYPSMLRLSKCYLSASGSTGRINRVMSSLHALIAIYRQVPLSPKYTKQYKHRSNPTPVRHRSTVTNVRYGVCNRCRLLYSQPIKLLPLP